MMFKHDLHQKMIIPRLLLRRPPLGNGPHGPRTENCGGLLFEAQIETGQARTHIEFNWFNCFLQPLNRNDRLLGI